MSSIAATVSAAPGGGVTRHGRALAFDGIVAALPQLGVPPLDLDHDLALVLGRDAAAMGGDVGRHALIFEIDGPPLGQGRHGPVDPARHERHRGSGVERPQRVVCSRPSLALSSAACMSAANGPP
jgi:hypothetical protein